jgi:prepilin-type processing-associated H-X9-DG protein
VVWTTSVQSYSGYNINYQVSFKKIDNFISATSKIPVFWDDDYTSGTSPSPFGGYPQIWYNGGGSWYKFDFRHNNALNVAFLDGHVGMLSGSTQIRPASTRDYLTAYDFPEIDWNPKVR